MNGEVLTRHIPYEAVEASYANNRAPEDRTPLPKPGDQVYYRRDYWDQNPILVVVTWVQDPTSTELVHIDPHAGQVRDPNLWHLIRDHNGWPLVDAGQLAYVQHPDPWPELRLRGEWAASPGMTPQVREATTRESRMRGSPGWLPLTWRDRPLRMASTIVTQPLAPAIERYRQARGGESYGNGA